LIAPRIVAREDPDPGSGGECDRGVSLALVEAVEELAEVLAGEVPVKRLGDLVVMVLELVERAAAAAVLAKSLGSKTLRWMIEW
jgi:hypothetical protein